MSHVVTMGDTHIGRLSCEEAQEKMAVTELRTEARNKASLTTLRRVNPAIPYLGLPASGTIPPSLGCFVTTALES